MDQVFVELESIAEFVTNKYGAKRETIRFGKNQSQGSISEYYQLVYDREETLGEYRSRLKRERDVRIAEEKDAKQKRKEELKLLKELRAKYENSKN